MATFNRNKSAVPNPATLESDKGGLAMRLELTTYEQTSLINADRL